MLLELVVQVPVGPTQAGGGGQPPPQRQIGQDSSSRLVSGHAVMQSEAAQETGSSMHEPELHVPEGQSSSLSQTQPVVSQLRWQTPASSMYVSEKAEQAVRGTRQYPPSPQDRSVSQGTPPLLLLLLLLDEVPELLLLEDLLAPELLPLELELVVPLLLLTLVPDEPPEELPDELEVELELEPLLVPLELAPPSEAAHTPFWQVCPEGQAVVELQST
jgi:hypothetical protein